MNFWQRRREKQRLRAMQAAVAEADQSKGRYRRERFRVQRCCDGEEPFVEVTCFTDPADLQRQREAVERDYGEGATTGAGCCGPAASRQG